MARKLMRKAGGRGGEGGRWGDMFRDHKKVSLNSKKKLSMDVRRSHDVPDMPAAKRKCTADMRILGSMQLDALMPLQETRTDLVGTSKRVSEKVEGRKRAATCYFSKNHLDSCSART